MMKENLYQLERSGRKRSLNAIVDGTIENMGRYRDKKYDLCICHGDVKEDADYVAGLLKEKHWQGRHND